MTVNTDATLDQDDDVAENGGDETPRPRRRRTTRKTTKKEQALRAADKLKRAQRIAGWLTASLQVKGMSIGQLQAASGISGVQIRNIAKGGRGRGPNAGEVSLPRKGTLEKVAAALGTDPTEVLAIAGYEAGSSRAEDAESTVAETLVEAPSVDLDAVRAEVLEATRALLESVYRADRDYYTANVDADLTAYEWFIAPSRIDGLDFHLHLMGEGGLEGVDAKARVDLLDPKVQLAGGTDGADVAVVTFTLLVTYPAAGTGKPTFYSDNQTRVLARDGESGWKLIHFHRSPTHV